MSTTIKCDITGQSNIPTFKVDKQEKFDKLEEEGETHFNVPSFSLLGDKLEYQVIIRNRNGVQAIDTAQIYVLEELHKLTLLEINKIKGEIK